MTAQSDISGQVDQLAATVSKLSIQAKDSHMPSESYTERANRDAVTAGPGSRPQQLLVILDLNGTLLLRSAHAVRSYRSRPGLDQFLQYLFFNHKVMVWTSMHPPNAEHIVDKLFGKMYSSLLLGTWARDTLGLKKSEYNNKVQVYKNLERVWASEDIQSQHPDYNEDEPDKQLWGQWNTILIDDSSKKATYQPHNHIEIDELNHDRLENETQMAKANRESLPLAKVTEYLQGAALYEDVSAYIRTTRYMRSEITERESKGGAPDIVESETSRKELEALPWRWRPSEPSTNTSTMGTSARSRGQGVARRFESFSTGRASEQPPYPEALHTHNTTRNYRYNRGGHSVPSSTNYTPRFPPSHRDAKIPIPHTHDENEDLKNSGNITSPGVNRCDMNNPGPDTISGLYAHHGYHLDQSRPCPGPGNSKSVGLTQKGARQGALNPSSRVQESSSTLHSTKAQQEDFNTSQVIEGTQSSHFTKRRCGQQNTGPHATTQSQPNAPHAAEDQVPSAGVQNSSETFHIIESREQPNVIEVLEEGRPLSSTKKRRQRKKKHHNAKTPNQSSAT